MKKISVLFLTICVMLFAFTACGTQQTSDTGDIMVTGIGLSDEGITVHGTPATEDKSAPVYVANDIIFYLENQGRDYGEGEKREEHSQREADKHTVIHITQPGTYMITGSLSHGQIAVDLGEKAKENPDSVVNLILNGVNLTSTVAPAIVCYSAYECGAKDVAAATKDVNTEAAGFNITLADGKENNISGSHVAKIYKPGTDDKLHKYDAAIESLVSMNINGTDGVLNLTADNEGIETKLHMTINGGVISINSRDDSLNAGEDYVSVITINDGTLLANANNGLEGDGIDSNGWVVVNGGSVSAFSSEKSMDSGIDSDNGILINGGTVYATGTMLDGISPESRQKVAVFALDEWVYGGEYIVLKNSQSETMVGFCSPADHKVMVYSSPQLAEEEYTLCKAGNLTGSGVNGVYTDITETTGESPLGHTERGGFAAGKGGKRPQIPEGGFPQFDDNMQRYTSGRPGFGGDIPSKGKGDLPADFDSERPEIDKNGRPVGVGGEGDFVFDESSVSEKFVLSEGINIFTFVKSLGN